MTSFIIGYVILFIIGIMICIFTYNDPEYDDNEERDSLVSFYLIMMATYTIMVAIVFFGG